MSTERHDQFDPMQQHQEEVQAYDESSQTQSQYEAWLRRHQQAYKSVFNNASPEDIQYVLADLAKFSHAYSVRFSTGESERTHCLREGRAELYYRIADAVELDHSTLYQKYIHMIQQGT